MKTKCGGLNHERRPKMQPEIHTDAAKSKEGVA